MFNWEKVHFAPRAGFAYSVRPKTVIRGGAGLPDLLDSVRTSTRGGVWLVDTWQASSRLSIEAGLRVDRAGLGHDTSLSPRASASLTLAPGTRVKIAGGRYAQSPGYEKFAQSDYVLDFTLTGKESFAGTTTVSFDLKDTDSALTLDLDKATVKSVSVNGKQTNRSAAMVWSFMAVNSSVR